MLRTIIQLSMATIMLSLAPAMPAFATDARTAIKLCDRNPKCDYKINDNGSVDLSVNGDQFIWCPQDGDCVCQLCGQKRKGEGQKRLSPVSSILRGKS